MGDLVWVRFFFYLHTSGDRIFSLTYKAIVWQVFPCKIFFHSKSVCRIFFPEITQLPPSKVKRSAPNKGEVQVTVNGILSLQRFARVDFLFGDKAAT